MQRSFSLIAAAVVGASLGLIGCAPLEEADSATSYHRDIRPIIEGRCLGCHTRDGLGPFSLEDYDAVVSLKELIKAETAARTMPPWLASPDCTTYAYDPSLTDKQIELIGKWADEGGPEGDDADYPGALDAPEGRPEDAAPVGSGDKAALRADITIEMNSEYTPPPALSDDYRCFVVDWPQTERTFVTGFATHPGNDKIVHHVILYLVPPDEVSKVEDLDAADPGEGYACYGGPGINDTLWLGAWAPGGAPGGYAKGTGIGVDPGSKVVLQMHYFVKGGSGGDLTSVDVQLEDSVEKEAVIFPFTSPAWLSGDNMLIPAGASDTAHRWDVGVHQITDNPFLVYSANMHMHQLGTSATLWVDRENGDRECMLDIRHWDFNWQLSYPFMEAKQVNPEDRIGIECHWDNSSANQGFDENGDPIVAQDVAWGDGTGDEMCLGVVYASSL